MTMTTPQVKNLLLAIIVLACIGWAGSASASLMIDFGGIKGGAGDGDIGPAHHEGAVASDNFDWLQYHTFTSDLGPETRTKDPFPSFVPNIDLSMESPANSGILDWEGFPWIGKNVIFEPTPGGQLDNAAVGDSVRGSQNGHASGFRIDLEPGSYGVYVTAAADLVGHELMRIFAGTSITGSSTTSFFNFEYEDLENTNRSTFELNDNYARFVLSVGVGESLIIVSDSQSSSEQAVWSSIQIVDASSLQQIPEPGTLSLLALPTLLLIFGFRRATRLRYL